MKKDLPIKQKKHILLSIGKIEDKRILLEYIKKLIDFQKDEIILYATDKTHKFLSDNKINSVLVYKISEIGQSPNIADLLMKKVFDIIINIPKRKKIRIGKEFTDGKLIRKTAVSMGIALVTDPEVAAMVLDDLSLKKNDN